MFHEISVSDRINSVILSQLNRDIELLEKAGCQVTAYKGEDISVKGGGGPTCLTRPMQRSY